MKLKIGHYRIKTGYSLTVCLKITNKNHLITTSDEVAGLKMFSSSGENLLIYAVNGYKVKDGTLAWIGAFEKADNRTFEDDVNISADTNIVLKEPENKQGVESYGIYKYTGPTMLIGEHNEYQLKSGMRVKAEVNINIAHIKKFVFPNGGTQAVDVDVAAKYLEPVKPDTIHFDHNDDMERNEPWYRNEIKRICKEHNWTLEIRSKDFLDIQVLEQTNKPNTYRQVAREHTEYINEKDVEVYKRLYERLVIISNKPKDDVRPDNFFDKLFEEIGKINAEHEIPVAYIRRGKPWSITEDEIKNYEKKASDILEKKLSDSDDHHEVGGDHYKMAIEPWDYIQANGLGFDEGNIVKYASRHKQKNGAEDIKKIISYAKHILKMQYGEDDR